LRFFHLILLYFATKSKIRQDFLLLLINFFISRLKPRLTMGFSHTKTALLSGIFHKNRRKIFLSKSSFLISTTYAKKMAICELSM